jgi:uncharacterized membrane protein YfcA
MCVLSGIFAGVFGLGGGIIKGPLMLEMGVLPAVAAASAAVMILFTSGGAIVGFALFGLIYADFGVFFFFWGFVCTMLGQRYMNRLIGKSRGQALIVLCIGAIMALSAVLMLIEAIEYLIEDPYSISRFSQFCFFYHSG